MYQLNVIKHVEHCHVRLPERRYIHVETEEKGGI